MTSEAAGFARLVWDLIIPTTYTPPGMQPGASPEPTAPRDPWGNSPSAKGEATHLPNSHPFDTLQYDHTMAVDWEEEAGDTVAATC